ncbi:unnamed protein product [Penicillium camemberti]|uniref:Str. FM013 n=1 Tax=Penicillium camemberti (strain FM 013) TaxID=1429867 RepID=A0A0G4P1Y4_PENC3|nr:unnamed protein product [Penicillium camemberti]
MMPSALIASNDSDETQDQGHPTASFQGMRQTQSRLTYPDKSSLFLAHMS